MDGEPPAIGRSLDDALLSATPEPSTSRLPDDAPGERGVDAVGHRAEWAPSIDLPPQGADPTSDQWADTVAQLNARGAITALVRELAMQAQCLGLQVDGERKLWRLKVERESLCSDGNRERLALALAQTLSCEAVIELERGRAHNTPAQRDQVARERKQQEAQLLIEGDALVRSLLAQYRGARIVPGSVRPL